MKVISKNDLHPKSNTKINIWLVKLDKSNKIKIAYILE